MGLMRADRLAHFRKRTEVVVSHRARVQHPRILVAIAACLCLLSAPSRSADPEYNTVIRHGRVVDGTGNPAVHADVAIKDGKIAAVGRVAGAGKTELDARGLIVAPGFIDVHTHAED